MKTHNRSLIFLFCCISLSIWSKNIWEKGTNIQRTDSRLNQSFLRHNHNFLSSSLHVLFPFDVLHLTAETLQCQSPATLALLSRTPVLVFWVMDLSAHHFQSKPPCSSSLSLPYPSTFFTFCIIPHIFTHSPLPPIQKTTHSKRQGLSCTEAYKAILIWWQQFCRRGLGFFHLQGSKGGDKKNKNKNNNFLPFVLQGQGYRRLIKHLVSSPVILPDPLHFSLWLWLPWWLAKDAGSQITILFNRHQELYF